MDKIELKVENLFKENKGEFTIFVVEQNFAVNNGYKYFKSCEDSKGYIRSEKEANYFLKNRILPYLFKVLEPVSELVNNSFIEKDMDITKVVNSLYKLFTVHEHQVAGPEIIDPIIIQEGTITKKQVTQLISLYEKSITRPRIIIILKDNNFERAKSLLSLCPNKTAIKFIRNDYSVEFDYVLNTGVENINDFIDVFSRQCYNACSNTPTDIIYNKEWAEDSLIKEWAPSLLKIRTKLLYGEKLTIIEDLNNIINSLSNKKTLDTRDQYLTNSFEGISKLFRVFCNDLGGKDILDAINISKKLDNEIFEAHTLRYSGFRNDISFKKEIELLNKAQMIFAKNNMIDHSIYCENNKLMKSFYTNNILTVPFENMVNKALHNVPGLVGLPILYNNLGSAYLYDGDYEKAFNSFENGLEAFPQKDHKLGLMTNKLIAKSLNGDLVNENELINVINYALLHFNNPKEAFLSIPHIINIIFIAQKSKYDMFDYLRKDNVTEKINQALQPNAMGRDSLAYQLHILKSNFTKELNINLTKSSFKPNTTRKMFMELNKGLNPAIFNSWL